MAMLRMVRHVHKETGEKNLCMAGGVALNCVGNGRVLHEGPFEKIWIQPAAGDAGGALGAALSAWYQYLDNTRNRIKVCNGSSDGMKGSYLGPSYRSCDIKSFLDQNTVAYQQLKKDALIEKTAAAIANGKIVGWFQGRMEFGPRALGARSILADPRSTKIQSRLNQKIKFRENFRPFAPSVLREAVTDYFDLDCDSPYMLLVAPVRSEIRHKISPEHQKLSGIDKLHIPRSTIPAVTHVDYSARVQTVHRDENSMYYDLISEFARLTGCPVVINTSFNVRGEPIVCSLEDAYQCFMSTDMDMLVLEEFILDKEKQSELPNSTAYQGGQA